MARDDPKCATRIGSKGSGSIRIVVDRVVIDQNSLRRTVQIIVLPGPDGPDERGQSDRAENKRCRDQDQQDIHDSVSEARCRCRRNAFSVTSNDDDDMATAATSGVTNPAIANGTAMAL